MQILLVSDIEFMKAKKEIETLKETIHIHRRGDLRAVWKILKQIEEGE